MIVHEGLTAWGAESVTASPCLRGCAAAEGLFCEETERPRDIDANRLLIYDFSWNVILDFSF